MDHKDRDETLHGKETNLANESRAIYGPLYLPCFPHFVWGRVGWTHSGLKIKLLRSDRPVPIFNVAKISLIY